MPAPTKPPREVYIPALEETVEIRAIPPKLIRELERRATKNGKLNVNEFEVFKFCYGVVDPDFTLTEVREITKTFGPAFKTVIAVIDELSGCEDRIRDVTVMAPPASARASSPAPTRLRRQALRTAALVTDVMRRRADERQLQLRARERRPSCSRHRGSRRVTRAGPKSDPDLPDEDEGEHVGHRRPAGRRL